MAENFGMLSEAYFLGRAALIEWINNFLECRIEKVEECATGALYCNLWDALHPNTIPMSKVDFTVKQEFEYMKNWKILQEGFQKAGVKKMIPVEKLIKAKYQDNLEFLQWMYQYAHQVYNGNCSNPQYNALERRLKSKGGKEFGAKFVRRQNATSFKPLKDINNKENNTSIRSSFTGNNTSVQNTPTNIETKNISRSNNDDFKKELDELRQENAKLQTNNSTLERKMESLSDVAKDIEKERDFYFNKVLKIEALLKEYNEQSIPLIKTIFDILYQTDEQTQNDENSNPNKTQEIIENDAELIRQN